MTTPQTEAARDDMRFASKYIEEYYQAEEIKNPAGEKLRFALKYIAQARQKDPGVTLKVKLRNKSVGLSTLDALEAEVLFLQGSSICKPGADPSDRKLAISLLTKSIQLEPIASASVMLAYAYIYNYERAKALSLLKDDLKKDPQNFELRSALDSIEAKPDGGVRETNFRPIVIAVGFLLLVGGCGGFLYHDTLTGESNRNPGSFLFSGLIIFLLTAAVIFAGFQMSKPPR